MSKKEEDYFLQNIRGVKPIEKKHHIRKMRIRTKECFKCNNQNEVLYRCRYDEFKNWVFLCGTCLTKIKSQYVNTYQYGGTWKNKKN